MKSKFQKQGPDLADVERFIRERAPQYSPPIAARLLRALRKELIIGVRAGERLSDLRKRIAKILDDQGPFRALKIARTEVVGAFESGTLKSYERSGVVEKKGWLTARDANVRPTQAGDFNHQDADGQEQPLNLPFIVSGERLMFPGDPAGSPGNIINCRCTQVPVISRQQ